MKKVKLAIVSAGAPLASACLPVTAGGPLGTTAKPAEEPALPGTWKGYFAGQK